MLYGDQIIGITFGFQLGKIGKQFIFKHIKITGMNFKNRIACHVVFSTISQHPLARWRLPPEQGGLVETDECPVPVGTHIQVFYTKVVVIITKVPANTVYIVLHGCFHFHSFRLYQRDGPE